MCDIHIRSNDIFFAGNDLAAHPRPEVTAAERFEKNSDRLRNAAADTADKKVIAFAPDKDGVTVRRGDFETELCRGSFSSADDNGVLFFRRISTYDLKISPAHPIQMVLDFLCQCSGLIAGEIDDCLFGAVTQNQSRLILRKT